MVRGNQHKRPDRSVVRPARHLDEIQFDAANVWSSSDLKHPSRSIRKLQRDINYKLHAPTFMDNQPTSHTLSLLLSHECHALSLSLSHTHTHTHIHTLTQAHKGALIAVFLSDITNHSHVSCLSYSEGRRSQPLIA